MILRSHQSPRSSASSGRTQSLEWQAIMDTENIDVTHVGIAPVGHERHRARNTARGSIETADAVSRGEPALESPLVAQKAMPLPREEMSVEVELLGTVSHELRTPLAAIKGYATTLLRHEERLPQAERREFLEAIEHASDRLEIVIDRLLEMSQLEAGCVKLQRFPVDIKRAVDDAVMALRERMYDELDAVGPGSFHGPFTFAVTRKRDAGEGAAENAADPLIVHGDARRLRHVLDHVLENAVKYSPGGGTIDITLRTLAPGACATVSALAGVTQQHRDLVEIEVHDRGIGIPAEHLDRVFERFHRIDRRLARESDGLGLGLAIARRSVELHGGVMWAQSTPGDGTSVHICLPLAGEEETVGQYQAHWPAGESLRA